MTCLGKFWTDAGGEKTMVHCMVNLVTANDCANVVLASGASPIMAEDAEETIPYEFVNMR